MTSTHIFYQYHHIEYMTRLIQMGLFQELQNYFKQLPTHIQENLQIWINQHLNIDDAKNDQLPLSVQLQIKGWSCYYQADYINAHVYFSQSAAQVDWQHYATTTALGLAKVYTRSGHWENARQWCLYFLDLARQQHNTFALTQGYGALAEIFIRSNYAQQALACFQIAHQLMPIGQGQYDKQLNYIASALIRNHENLRAETLLRTSIKISSSQQRQYEYDESANLSFWHSLARLSFNRLFENEKSQAPLTNEEQKYLNKESLQTGFAAIPCGFVHTAMAIYHLQQGENAVAISYLTTAKKLFGTQSIMESQWVKRLLSEVEQKIDPDDMKLNPMLELTPLDPPHFCTVVDLIWQQPNLNNHGFNALFDPNLDLKQLTLLWTLFFI